MTVNEFFATTKNLTYDRDGRLLRTCIRPAIVCADGLRLSVQASSTHYCEPRVSDADFYSEVEVGFPSSQIAELMPYAENPDNPTKTVYPYVPIEIVDSIIAAHGGIVK